MPNNVDDLRKHLFETLAGLKDKTAPMDLDRARAVADVARVLVDTAKVEVEFLKVTGGVKSTDFLPDGDENTVATARRINGHVVDPARRPA